MCFHIRAGVMALLLAASTAAPGAAQSLAAVETGLKVAVVDDRGSQIEGRVQSVSDQSVRLSVRGASRDIPVDHIVRIERPDTVKNGALTGLTVGLALGVAGTAADPQGGGVLVWRTLGNGLVCAGIGALIDAAVDGRKTLYERGTRTTQARLTPVVGRGVRSLAFSLEW